MVFSILFLFLTNQLAFVVIQPRIRNWSHRLELYQKTRYFWLEESGEAERMAEFEFQENITVYVYGIYCDVLLNPSNGGKRH